VLVGVLFSKEGCPFLLRKFWKCEKGETWENKRKIARFKNGVLTGVCGRNFKSLSLLFIQRG
jgi:hypothetical protein